MLPRTSVSTVLLGASTALLASAYNPDIIRARQTGGGSGEISIGDIINTPGTAISEQCSSALSGLEPLLSSLPTPDYSVIDAIITNPDGDEDDQTGNDGSEEDDCVEEYLPHYTDSTIQSAFESYATSAISWWSANSDAVASAVQMCTELSGFEEAFSISVPPCTSGATTADSATMTTTATSTDDSSSSSEASTVTSDGDATATDASSQTSSPTAAPTPAAAPRETGLMVATVAVLLAGIFGFAL